MDVSLNTVATLLGVIGTIAAAVGMVWNMARRVERAVQRIEGSADAHKVLFKGVYAALDGLHQLGANGPVTEALHELKDHLIESAEQ